MLSINDLPLFRNGNAEDSLTFLEAVLEHMDLDDVVKSEVWTAVAWIREELEECKDG